MYNIQKEHTIVKSKIHRSVQNLKIKEYQIQLFR